MQLRMMVSMCLVICCVVWFGIMIVNADETAWDNLDLTYKSPRDSVSWENIDLVEKPPQTPSNDREHPGEKIGLHGPVITHGGKGRKEAIVVYDPSGVCTGVITVAEAKKDPAGAETALGQACDGSTNHAIVRYFDGQTLTGQDLTSLVDYMQDKSRLYRPELFGTGVVQGLDVTSGPATPSQPQATPGVGVTSEGDLIDIQSDTVISARGGDSLRGQGSAGGGQIFGGPDDKLLGGPGDDRVGVVPGGDDVIGGLDQDVIVGGQGEAPVISAQGGDNVSTPVDPNRERQMSDNWMGGAVLNSWGEPLLGTHRIPSRIVSSRDDNLFEPSIGSTGEQWPQTQVGPDGGPITPRIGFTYDVRGDGRHVVRPQNPWQSSGLMPSGFQPESGLVLRAGLTRDQLKTLVKDIIAKLIGRSRKGGFFRDFARRPGVYRLVIVRIRIIQEDTEREPNDPLFFVPKKKPRKGFGAFFFGSGVVRKKKNSDFGVGGMIGVNTKEKASINDQWALQQVGFLRRKDPASAWNIEDGSEKNVVVAIIDSGLYMEHPDGPQYIWTNANEISGNGIDDDNNGYVDDVHGWNFIDEDNDLTDERGHGTFIAGIIAAKTNNGIGIAGINSGAQIMPVKVVDKKGMSDSMRIWRAIRYAVDNGAQVINISLGEYGISPLEQLAVNYAYTKGVLVVVAAGNEGKDLSEIAVGPAGLRRVITVGALNYEGTASVISNHGSNLAILAPGEEIYSLYAKGTDWKGSKADRQRLYYTMSGTSFSAPFVTGTISLMLAHNPMLTPGQIEDILLDTATPLSDVNWDTQNGAGLLNAYAALSRKPSDAFLVRPTEVVVTKEKQKISFVDIFGVIRGDMKSYRVELGKGKDPRRWQEVFTSNERPLPYGLLARIDGRTVSRGKDWVARITATDREGRMRTATLVLSVDIK